ncbi:hypothetical protein CFAM422_000602 [Trichoderma lentiforme]|uniref:Complex III subunit 9 n=1 Tax=Trichoderma lentiforme TaxID=1567552 RepID=A0A9P4XQE5_9HYPO|nr:hypothetical protein CFAM422_000602 [Trichoderma lentiforme]
MLAAVFGAGFAWEMYEEPTIFDRASGHGFNATMNNIWDSNNRGRQWKDIRHKYIEGGEDEE